MLLGPQVWAERWADLLRDYLWMRLSSIRLIIDIAYRFGTNLVDTVIKAGKLVKSKNNSQV